MPSSLVRKFGDVFRPYLSVPVSVRPSQTGHHRLFKNMSSYLRIQELSTRFRKYDNICNQLGWFFQNPPNRDRGSVFIDRTWDGFGDPVPTRTGKNTLADS